MPIQKTITLYTFDELSDTAKEKARQWYLEGEDFSFASEHILGDAKEIGLKIISLNQHRSNQGEFIDGAFECASRIVTNHGKDCETYKTADDFLKKVFVIQQEEDAERSTNDLDELEGEFLHALLEDYRIMLEKECEYMTSDEYVDEMISNNDYTFAEDGKRMD